MYAGTCRLLSDALMAVRIASSKAGSSFCPARILMNSSTRSSLSCGRRWPTHIASSMRAGQKLDPPFEGAIRAAIRASLSSRHVPAYILEVKELPYTVNGKKIEIAVKKIVSGMRVVPSATVANPESLESYYQYQDIEKFAQPSTKGNGRDAKL